MAPSKCLLLVLDGLGDRQFPELDNRTPLQSALTPNLDLLAHLGANGLYHPGCLGEPLPSENAHFSLFGYSDELFPGRGPVEALGMGLNLRRGEVAVLAHFVSASNRNGALFIEQDRPFAKESSEVQTLFDSVGCFQHKEVLVNLHQTKGLFGVLILQGEVSPMITDSNPMRDHAFAMDVTPTAEGSLDPGARRCAEALRAYLNWVYHSLDMCEINLIRRKTGLVPINAMVTQRAGCMASVESFSKLTGLKGACLASGVLYQGLAKLIGLEAMDVSAKNDVRSDFSAKLQLAQDLLSDFDFVHVHTKAPDEAAHSKNFRAKCEVITELDRALEPYMHILAEDPNILTVITSDHSSPSAGPMIHSGEPVPLTMRGITMRRDRVSAFDEISACTGVLGQIQGKGLMRLVLNALNMAKLHGIRDVPKDRMFWPGPAPSLRLD